MHSRLVRQIEVANSRRTGPRRQMMTAIKRQALLSQPCGKRGERAEKRLDRELARFVTSPDVAISAQAERAARKKPTPLIDHSSN